MGWLANLLKTRRLAIAIGFLLLILLVWVVGLWWLEFTVETCLLLTMAVLFIWVLLLLLEKSAADKGANLLEQSIKSQSEEQVMGVRPEKREEVENLRQQLSAAIDSLKKSKLGKGRRGSSALYALPWYMIIGPPAAGKTTAIRHSGLEFPFGADHEIQGVGGTRNCDWWFTSSAILLDTAGRYTTEEDDREEWIAFLDILKKYRRRQPINGILIGISIADLLSTGLEEVEWHAKNIRKRIDELIQRLGVKFPVYLVFTKCDLLNGFVEFFEDFSRVQRGQVWGCTLSKEQLNNPNPRGVFEQEFQLLYDSLVSMRLSRLSSGLKREGRKQVYAFPMQFLSAKENLAHFVGKLLQPNPYQESPIFRGFYFTSGTQEGVPIDRVVQSIAQSYGLPPDVVDQFSPEMKTKSYFIRDLFADIIIPDERLVSLTSRSERNRRYARMGVIAVAVVGLAVFVLGVFQAYVRSKTALDATARDVEVAKVAAADSASLYHRSQLLLTRIQQLQHPPFFAFGMDRSATVLSPARALFYRWFRPFVQRNVVTVLEERLRRGNHQPGGAYDELKAYLLLTSEADRLHDSQDYQNFLGTQLGKIATSGASMKDALAFFAKDFGDAVHDSLTHPFPFDRGVVGVARAEASRFDVRDVYARLKSRSSDQQPFTYADGVLHSTYALPGIFTKTGAQNMEKTIENEFTDPGTEATWVLALKDSQLGGALTDKKQTVDELENLYYQDYASEWDKFLRGLEYDSYNEIGTASAHLKQLADVSSSPLKQLLSQVADQTTFEGALSKQVREKAKSIGANIGSQDPVDARFAGLHAFVANPSEQGKTSDLGSIMAQFDLVGNALDGLKNSPPKSSKEYAANVLKGGSCELIQALQEIRKVLNAKDMNTRDELRNLFEQPIHLAWRAVLENAMGYLNDQWHNQVADPYRQIAGYYPFDPASTRDAPPGDVAALFGPDGGLWKFVATDLRPFISGDDTWEAAQWEHEGLNLSTGARDALKGASFLSKALIRGNDVGAKVEIKIQRPSIPDGASNFDRVCVMIGGQENCFKWKEDVSTSFAYDWPGQQPARGAGIRIINDRFLFGEKVVDEKKVEGVWGLFRLLAFATRSAGDNRAENKFRWSLTEGIGVTVVLKTDNSFSNPFSRSLAVNFPDKLN